VFGLHNKDALNTPYKLANYHVLGRVLNSPPLDAKYNMSIIMTCKEDVMMGRLRLRSGII